MKESRRRIILVDDHVVMRAALRELIEKIGNYEVIHEFSNGKDLIDKFGSVGQADLILLDISMPVMNGVDTLARLKTLENKLPVLVLTDADDDQQAVKVFRLGARGYLRKSCTARELSEAFSEIFSSGYYHNQYFTMSIHQDAPAVPSSQKAREAILQMLTARERQFLKLVTHPDEYMYAQIADQMKITPRAVEKCREDLFAKLKIKSKAGLVIFVYRNSLFDDL